MPSILFVGALIDSHTDNLNRLQQAFSTAGWRAECVTHNDLLLKDGTLAYRTNDDRNRFVTDFDWIWVLGFGERSTFLDRVQLLSTVQDAQFVNTMHALLVYHNKAALALTDLREHTPSMHVSNEVEFLVEQIRQGGQWITKPTAGSFGRDVFELTIDSPNLRQILENLTRQGYAIVQRRIDTSREQRWFLAMGEVVGAYQKTKSDLRGNLGANAIPSRFEPRSDEINLAKTIARKLAKLGIRAAAVDLAYPYLLDVNFVNPGWFESMESLSGRNYATDLPALFHSKRS